jgi:hypothetical protein
MLHIPTHILSSHALPTYPVGESFRAPRDDAQLGPVSTDGVKIDNSFLIRLSENDDFGWHSISWKARHSRFPLFPFDVGQFGRSGALAIGNRLPRYLCPLT